MDVHTEQITAKETRIETQEDGSVVSVEREAVKTHLYIDTVSLTAEEAANRYGFDTKQREQLGELLSDRNKEMRDTLFYNSEGILLKLKGMSPIQYRTHSKAIQYLILSKFWGRFRHDAPLSFYSFLSP